MVGTARAKACDDRSMIDAREHCGVGPLTITLKARFPSGQNFGKFENMLDSSDPDKNWHFEHRKLHLIRVH